MTFKNFSKIGLLLSLLLIAAACNKTTQNNQPNTAAQPQPQPPAQSSTVSYNGQDGKTALQLLEQKFLVVTKGTPGNETVFNINGLAADPSQAWNLYVNGKKIATNAAEYKTKSSDKIEWRLEKN